jgi:hypothetical protein
MPEIQHSIVGTVGSQTQVDASQQEVRMEPWRRSMKTRTISLALSLTMFGFSLAHAETMSLRENNVDRPCEKCDIKIFDATNGDPTICENECAVLSSCRAWNFDPGTGTPRCFLKNIVPTAKSSPGLISGVKIY